MKSIKISPQVRIGPGHPCFIIAEVGINHNGDLTLAKEMIAAAAEAGADSVKFQNYRTEDFMSNREQTYSYRSGDEDVVESMYDMFKRYEIGPEFLSELKATCDKEGVVFTSTPTSQAGIDDLVSVGAPLLKNGSDFLTNSDLIRQMAETQLPTILSCGMSTEKEIDEAVRVYREADNDQLILLHCTSSYPTAAEDVHLRKLHSLKQKYQLPVGLSDHTDGIIAGVIAASMGAAVIEKHFTIDKQLSGPDHSFSSDPKELKQLIKSIREAELMLGSSTLRPTKLEEESRQKFRLSCVAKTTIEKGKIITLDNLAYKRPGSGIPPKEASTLIGKRTRRTVPKDTVFSVQDFD